MHATRVNPVTERAGSLGTGLHRLTSRRSPSSCGRYALLAAVERKPDKEATARAREARAARRSAGTAAWAASASRRRFNACHECCQDCASGARAAYDEGFQTPLRRGYYRQGAWHPHLQGVRTLALVSSPAVVQTSVPAHGMTKHNNRAHWRGRGQRRGGAPCGRPQKVWSHRLGASTGAVRRTRPHQRSRVGRTEPVGVAACSAAHLVELVALRALRRVALPLPPPSLLLLALPALGRRLLELGADRVQSPAAAHPGRGDEWYFSREIRCKRLVTRPLWGEA